MKNTDLSRYSCRAEAYEASEDTPSNRSEATSSTAASAAGTY